MRELTACGDKRRVEVSRQQGVGQVAEVLFEQRSDVVRIVFCRQHDVTTGVELLAQLFNKD